MFDNKTMLLLILGLVIFLLSRPSKNVIASNQSNTETEVTTESTEDSKEENSVEKAVEKFGNVDSTRVNQRYGKYPFLKQDCVDDSCDDVEFEAEDVISETNDKVEKEEEEVNTKPHSVRVDAKGTKFDKAFNSVLAPGCDVSQIPDNRTANLNKDDLLPGEATNDWFESVTVELDDDALITSSQREQFGINTIGSSLRNASLDIRGEIGLANPIRKYAWNNSTITPDTNLKNSVLSNN